MENINYYLQQRLDSPATPAYQFSKEHIFFSLFTKVSDTVSLEEKMDMLYHFNCYNKILSTCRSGKLHLAESLIATLQETPLNIGGNAGNGMLAIYYPMISYYHFVHKNFAPAQSCLQQSITLLQALNENGIADATVARIEQILNLFKIHIAAADGTAAAETAAGLIAFVYTGECSALFPASFTNSINTFDQIGLIHHYTNEILRKLTSLFKPDDNPTAHKRACIQALLSLLSINAAAFNTCPLPELPAALHLALQGEIDDDTFLSCLNKYNYFKPEIPMAVQCLLLKRLHTLGNVHDIASPALLAAYYKQILGVNYAEVTPATA